MLRTDYASVVEPTVEFIDAVRADHPHDQVVVLIPVVRPNRARYRLLHNQIDLALSSTLRKRDDIVVAHVSVPLEPSAGPEAASTGGAATVPVPPRPPRRTSPARTARRIPAAEPRRPRRQRRISVPSTPDHAAR